MWGEELPCWRTSTGMFVELNIGSYVHHIVIVLLWLSISQLLREGTLKNDYHKYLWMFVISSGVILLWPNSEKHIDEESNSGD